MDSERPTGFSRLPAASAVSAGRIRAHVRHRRAAVLGLGAALLRKPFFLGEDDHAGARGRKYRRIPFDDRPAANGMGRSADPAGGSPDGRSDFPQFVGGDHCGRPADGLLLIGV